MGSFVTLFNYIGYRLMEPPYHFNQAVVGMLSMDLSVRNLQCLSKQAH